MPQPDYLYKKTNRDEKTDKIKKMPGPRPEGNVPFKERPSGKKRTESKRLKKFKGEETSIRLF